MQWNVLHAVRVPKKLPILLPCAAAVLAGADVYKRQKRILELDFLGDRHAVVRDERGTCLLYTS